MICPFCSKEIPPEIEGDIDIVSYYCSSACDMAAKLDAICPHCNRVFWSQWVEIAYLWEWEERGLSSLHLSDEEREGWANPLSVEKGRYEWEYTDGKLHCYVDIEDLPGVIEITER